MNFKSLFLFLFGLFFAVSALGQEKQGANWFFGGDGTPLFPGIHLNFNSSVLNPVYFNYDYNRGGGVATISDKNGELLFFSSIGHVATRQNLNNKYQQTPNGSVFGNSWTSTIAELIIQSPQDEQVYYLFLISNAYFFSPHDLYVVKIDMRLNNGLGDVVPGSLQLLKKNVAQGMSAMLHANQKDYWLLSASEQGDSLRAYPVSAAGIGTPVISLNNKALEKISWFKSAPNSEMFVSTGSQGIELFSFNRQAGTVALLYTLFLPDSAQQKGFSYTFSPNSSKLYVGTQSRPGQTLYSIVQYDLAAGSLSQIQQSASSIYSFNSPSVAAGQHFISDMQLAIDGRIYVAIYDFGNFVHRINYPDLAGIACGWQRDVVYTHGYFVWSLPALNQTLFRNAGILQAQAYRDTICLGDSVKLSAYGAGVERFRWQLANGLTAPADTLANPVVRPTATTTYRVIASSPFRTDTAFVKVVVLGKSTITVTGPEQLFTFAENQEYKASGQGAGTLTWSVTGGTIVSGQGTSSIKVNWDKAGAGEVSVSETNRFGCPTGKAALAVEITGSPLPVFYNIITPNGDNRNETFTIENLKWYPQYELQIFNHWGKQVYQSSNYQNNWNGNNLSAGVYYYYFRAGKQSWKGWVEVSK